MCNTRPSGTTREWARHPPAGGSSTPPVRSDGGARRSWSDSNRDQGRSARGTDGGRGKRAGEPRPFAGQTVDVRRLDGLLAITAEVGRHVVDHDPDDVRSTRGVRGSSSARTGAATNTHTTASAARTVIRNKSHELHGSRTGSAWDSSFRRLLAFFGLGALRLRTGFADFGLATPALSSAGLLGPGMGAFTDSRHAASRRVNSRALSGSVFARFLVCDGSSRRLYSSTAPSSNDSSSFQSPDRTAPRGVVRHVFFPAPR